MSTLIVRNLPEALHERLKRQAQRNHRSVSREVVNLIEAGVAGQTSARKPGRQALTLQDIDASLSDERYSHLGSLDDLERHMDELRSDRDEPTE